MYTRERQKSRLRLVACAKVHYQFITLRYNPQWLLHPRDSGRAWAHFSLRFPFSSCFSRLFARDVPAILRRLLTQLFSSSFTLLHPRSFPPFFSRLLFFPFSSSFFSWTERRKPETDGRREACSVKKKGVSLRDEVRNWTSWPFTPLCRTLRLYFHAVLHSSFSRDNFPGV